MALRVYYLWDFGVAGHVDPRFGERVTWDIPLLSGYQYSFVPNLSKRPGTTRFFGLWNPDLVRQIRACEPHAVLVMGYNFASLIYLIFRWPSRRIPLIFRGDSHRIIRPEGLRAYMRRRVIGAVFKRFSAFLYVGSANYDYFRYHGVPDEKLFRSPHAVDNERFLGYADAENEAARWKQELGIAPADVVILFAGKFEPKKRPLDLLHAFLAAKLSGVSLLFVGSGELEGPLRVAAGQNPKVHFAPFQNQMSMPRTYSAGDIFVLPSYGSGETWGLAVNEAMCMGRAVIVSDHVGCARDLVVPYENGLIFAAGDVAALARCLTEAVSDRTRLAEWGARSRTLIQEYSYANVTDGLLAAMNSLGLVRK
jgi:glycosyltransferase involved in cell wall biosynthesis